MASPSRGIILAISYVEVEEISRRDAKCQRQGVSLGLL
jgi:hypothetical protein